MYLANGKVVALRARLPSLVKAPTCSLHDSGVEIVGANAWSMLCPLGTHPVFKALAVEDVRCHAARRSLVADRALAMAAMSNSVPGFAYLHEQVLVAVRRFETGGVYSVASYGRGYCYLWMVRPGLRMRVARILGPVPYLREFLVVLRLVGSRVAKVRLRVVAEGLLHCEEGDSEVLVRDVVAEMHGLLLMDEHMRVGAEETVMASGKVFCQVCRTMINPVGHVFRCRPQRIRRPVAELLGDAVHALDVKTLLVMALPYGAHYTEHSKRFLVASAQRQWLESVGVKLPVGYSDHTWASEFESRYHGPMRRAYIAWLAGELQVPVDVAFQSVADPVSCMAMDASGEFEEKDEEVVMGHRLHLNCLAVMGALVVLMLIAVFK